MKKRTLSAVISRLVVVGLACGTSACSTTGKKNDAIAKGATIGALSGAALGGGVGAIVGSTSGHLGEGVAVGALAGGVAGAGLGAAVGDYRAKQTSRADSVADQDKQFQEQRKDLNSVKDSLGDDVGMNSQRSPHGSAYGASSSKTASSYGIMEGYHGNPRAKAFRPAPGTAIPSSVMASRRTSPSSSQIAKVQWNSGKAESRARLSESSSGVSHNRVANKVASGTSYQDTEARKIDNDLLARESGEDLDAIGEPPVRKVTQSGAVVTTRSITSAVTGERAPSSGTLDTTARETAGRVGLPVAKSGTISAGAGVGASESAMAIAERSAMEAKPALEAKTEARADGAVVAKQLGKLPADSSASCIQAEKEAARATNATSDADRLFYLGRASRLCPTSDTYQVELGKVFAKIGKTQEAKSAFRKASDLNPQNDVARDELSILENSAQ